MVELIPRKQKPIVVTLERQSTESFTANWVQFAAAVIGKAIEMSKERKFNRWQEEVSGQLATIIGQLANIEQQLRDMQVWLDERIAEETRSGYHRRIVTLCKHVNQILRGIGQQEHGATKTQLDDLAADFRDLQLTMSDLMQTDGYLHSMAVVAGTACVVPMFYLLDRETELSAFVVSVLDYLRNAVSPDQPKSLESARRVQVGRIISYSAALASRLDRAWLTNYTDGYDPNNLSEEKPRNPGVPARPAEGSTQSASGSVRDGFTRGPIGHPRPTQFPPWYPDLTARLDVGNEAASWAMMLASLEGFRTEILRFEANEDTLSANIEEITEVIAQLEKLA